MCDLGQVSGSTEQNKKTGILFKKLNWSRRQDLNLQPLGPKPNALPNCATSRGIQSIKKKINGAPRGTRTRNL